MSTSFLGGRLLGGATGSRDYRLVSQDPVGACISRDFVLNNLLHFADEFAQVRVAWSATASGYRNGSGYLTGNTSLISADVWHPIVSFGPFPIALRQDGRSYRMRVRVAGASSGGHAVKFRMVLAPFDAAPGVVSLNEDFIFETATTTSGTGAWLTGTSMLSSWTTQVQISASSAAEWMATSRTISDISGNDTGVSQCLVNCNIFGSTANTGSTPRLHGLYAAEWVGDD